MSSAGPGRAAVFRLLALLALATAASAGAVKTATPAAAAAAGAREEEPSSGRMYMVPHLGNNPVLGPVTGAPPGKLAHVPLSQPSVSVRTKDDSEAQRRQPEKRTILLEPPSRWDDEKSDARGDAYYEALIKAAEKRRRHRRPQFDTR